MSESKVTYDARPLQVGDKTGATMNTLWFHRKEQYDLNCWPLICLHWRTPDSSTRLFCLYFWGVQIGKFRLNSKAIGWKHHIYRWGKGWWKP